jgi:hypothetical protein
LLRAAMPGTKRDNRQVPQAVEVLDFEHKVIAAMNVGPIGRQRPQRSRLEASRELLW